MMMYWKTSRTALMVASVLLGMAIAPTLARAGEADMLHQLEQYRQENAESSEIDSLSFENAEPGDGNLGQVNSVNQLTDISPSDWAFQAVKNMVERYQCLEGYPDQTFRGNRPVTRFEFAAALNACLDRVLEIVGGGEGISASDFATLRSLVEEFEGELAVIRGRVDDLESRTAQLEANQFSTTTKFRGEISFSVSGVLGDERAGGGDLLDNTVFDQRTRLFFNTSFTGTDILLTRLDSLNTVPFGSGEEEDDPNVTGTGMTRLAFDEGSDNTFRLGKLFYSFPIGEVEEHDEEEGEEEHGHGHGIEGAKLVVIIDGIGGEFNENFPNFNEFFSEELTGAVSRFGRFNPIYYQGLEGIGASVNYMFSDAIGLSVGYLAPDATDPDEKNGLFNGSFAAMGQLSFFPSDRIEFGLTYVRSYFPSESLIAVSGETGSELANEPFGETPTAADHFGVQASVEVAPYLTVSGWAGVTLATAQADGVSEEGDFIDDGDDATIFNWAVTLAFPDVGGEGNLAGIIVGQPPRVLSNDGGPDEGDTAWHIEAQYRYQLNNNIAINPGIFVIINPENDNDNSAIVVGTIRTIFSF